jgi:hypothetical protein
MSCDRTTQSLVPRSVNCAHASRANEGENFIRTESFACAKRHGDQSTLNIEYWPIGSLDSKLAISRMLRVVNVWSGCRDLNPGPPAPQAGALARLRHSPNASFYRTPPSCPYFVCYT